MVMYWPASNGVGSPSKRTQKVASESVMSSRRTSVALYWGAAASMTRGSAIVSVMTGWYPHRSQAPGPFSVQIVTNVLSARGLDAGAGRAPAFGYGSDGRG